MPAAAAAPMPPSEGRSGNVFVWLISCLFFLILLAGGGFLVLYIALPETEDTSWFPIAGMILVGIPWVFWILTCFYRSISMRNRGEGEGEEEEGGGVGGERQPVAKASAINSPRTAAAQDSPVHSPGGARKVRFGNATVMGDGGAAAGKAPSGNEVDHGGSSATNDGGSSLNSHESEEPLALSPSSVA